MTTTAESMAPPAIPKELQDLPVMRIEPHPVNRKRFDPAKLAELTASIEAGGLITPITVRPHPTKDGWFQLIAGERRWQAHQRLERPTILGVVRDISDATAIQLLVVENAQREDPHPLEEADGYQALLDVRRTGALAGEPAITPATIGQMVGKSESYILQRLKLRELGAEGRQAFLAGRITFSHALLIARIPAARQAEVLAQAFFDTYDDKGKRIQELQPFRDFAEQVRDDFHLPLADAPFATKDAALCPAAGSCVACPKRSGFAPGLFPELDGKHDECTDRGCYGAKVQVHIKRGVVEARERFGDALVLISTIGTGSNPPKKDHPLARKFWKEAPSKTSKGAVPAVLVEDPFGGSEKQLGRLRYIVIEKPVTSAPGKKGKSSPKGSPRLSMQAEEAARKAAEEKAVAAAQRESARRYRVLEAVLAKTTKFSAFARIGLLLAALPDIYGRRSIAKLTKLPGGYAAAQLAIAKLDEAAYARETVLALVHRELGEWPVRRGDKAPILMALAQELKLDIKALLADPPAPEPKAQATAKPNAKAKIKVKGKKS